ncbi:MAG: molybdenum cofactor biosynthesis protein MoaE [Actinomycetaceae bacterium]|nr:molybdenum cofactor biosynthesis protein MoaE [Actinomycetaceae bacterium]
MSEAARIIRAGISSDPVDEHVISAEVQDDRAGAIVTFTGAVRNHDQGRGVTSIEYSSHPTAPQIMREILTEIGMREGVHAVSCVHRVGHVSVGQNAMVAVVAASHRSQAFSAVSDLVDEVKERLPVWKKQHFPDGSHEWTGIAELKDADANE